jgi:hypothetical protein
MGFIAYKKVVCMTALAQGLGWGEHIFRGKLRKLYNDILFEDKL